MDYKSCVRVIYNIYCYTSRNNYVLNILFQVKVIEIQELENSVNFNHSYTYLIVQYSFKYPKRKVRLNISSNMNILASSVSMAQLAVFSLSNYHRQQIVDPTRKVCLLDHQHLDICNTFCSQCTAMVLSGPACLAHQSSPCRKGEL